MRAKSSALVICNGRREGYGNARNQKGEEGRKEGRGRKREKMRGLGRGKGEKRREEKEKGRGRVRDTGKRKGWWRGGKVARAVANPDYRSLLNYVHYST